MTDADRAGPTERVIRARLESLADRHDDYSAGERDGLRWALAMLTGEPDPGITAVPPGNSAGRH